MCEFDGEPELSQNFDEPTTIDAVNGAYIMDAAEKQRLEERQIELYCDGEEHVLQGVVLLKPNGGKLKRR
jgi:hypothetical protein